MKKNSKGFTLLELLVVIVLLVMAISVTSVSIVSGQDGARMKTSARQLVSVLRSARVRAITDGVEAGITLGIRDTDPGRQALEKRVTENQNPQYRYANRAYTIIPTSEQVTLPEALSLSLKSTRREETVTSDSIMFYPDGSSSGGRLELSASAGTMTINVNWLTGEVVLDNGNAVSGSSFAGNSISDNSIPGNRAIPATVQ